MTEPSIVAMACVCGRSISAPAPELRDLQAAMATFVGWGWDDKGRVRCPMCIACLPPPATNDLHTPPQGSLFLTDEATRRNKKAPE